MNSLKAGFARVNITPPLGVGISGYFQERYAEKILDDLFVNAIALSAGGKTTILIAVDGLNMPVGINTEVRTNIANKCGIPVEAVYLSFTHTHTGPYFNLTHSVVLDVEVEYLAYAKRKMVDAAFFAFEDMKDAKAGIATSFAPRISFGRRYRMKDGSVRTNPGVKNPDIVEPIGKIDETVSLIRFDREGADTIALVSFATHPDVIGGNVISADWPAFVRSTLEAALGNVKCIFFNGAQGDVNHVNVSPLPGEENGLHKDFDDVDRGYAHSKHMGNVVAGAVLQVYEKVKYIDIDSIDYATKDVEVPANLPDPSEIPLAKKYHELHKAGRDDEIPFKGMGLTTEVARAARIVRLEHGPDSFIIPIAAVKVGSIGFVGFAGEPFSGIGMGVKANNEQCEMVIPNCLVNGSTGYFPMMDSYAEGGYESGSSNFKAGVGEILIDEATKLLKSLK